MDMVDNTDNVEQRDGQLEAFFRAILTDPEFLFSAEMPLIYSAFELKEAVQQQLVLAAGTRRSYERELQEAESAISGGRKQGWLWIRSATTALSWNWTWSAYWCEYRAGELACYTEPPPRRRATPEEKVEAYEQRSSPAAMSLQCRGGELKVRLRIRPSAATRFICSYYNRL